MANQLTIIDLSHHNAGPFDFKQAEAAGLVGVFHKCTEGTTMQDDQYWRRRQLVLDAGLTWGAYHYLHHGNIAEQMDWFMHNAQPEKGSRVAIDYEDEDLTLDDLRDAITTLQQIAPSLQLTVYAGHLLKQQLGSVNDPILAKTSLWIAQYTSAEQPTWPAGTWPLYSLWQYSDGSQGGQPRSIAGITGPVDCNAFNGSPANAVLWMGPPASPQPAPGPEPEVVGISVQLPAGVTLRIDVNGVEWRP